MHDSNKIKKKVQVSDFFILIRKYTSRDIEDSGHAFKRLSQRQREIFTMDEIRKILFEDKPFLVGIQENENYACFYKHQGKNLRIILKFDNRKVKIVTFYYVLDWQIPSI
jgi:hypothetical protein